MFWELPYTYIYIYVVTVVSEFVNAVLENLFGRLRRFHGCLLLQKFWKKVHCILVSASEGSLSADPQLESSLIESRSFKRCRLVNR